MDSWVLTVLLCLPSLILAEEFNATAAVAQHSHEFPNTEEPHPECVIQNAELPEFGPLNAISNPRLLWDQNTMYYEFQGSFTEYQKNRLRGGAAEIMRVTNYGGRQCIRIIESSNARNRVAIRKCGNACNSYVGKIGGVQQMCMADWCINDASMMHEFLHALGFNHEHQRPDRDNYIYVNFRNIQRRWYSAFQRMDNLLLLTGYDYGSLMHYGAYSSFAINQRQPVIIPRQTGAKIGQRRGLSAIDIERVQLLYGCKSFAESTYHKHLA